MKSVD